MWIAVEGNIGVGKSTLVRGLAKQMNWVEEGENVETDSNFQKHLSAFNNNTNHAIHLQRWLSSKRIRNARTRKRQKENYVVERSLLGDMVFTVTMHKRGYIEVSDYHNYLKEISNIFIKLPLPELVIYLKADTETCYNRLKQRNRRQESSLEKSYIQELNFHYDNLLPTYTTLWDTPFIEIDFNQYKTSQDVEQIIKHNMEKTNEVSTGTS